MRLKMLYMNPEEITLAYYGVHIGEGFSHLPLLPSWLTFRQIKPPSNCWLNDMTIAGIPGIGIQSASGNARMALRSDADLALII